MQFKDERIQEAGKEFSDFYYEISDNISEAARHMGITASANNQYINSGEHHLPFFLAQFHPKAKELAHWFCSKVGLNAVQTNIDETKLNGSVDDENLSIVAQLGRIIETLQTSRNGKAKMEAIARYVKIEELVMQAKHEIENAL